MVKHRSEGSERSEVRFSWIFFLFHTRAKKENMFLYFFTELKDYHLSYSIYNNSYNNFKKDSYLWHKSKKKKDCAR